MFAPRLAPAALLFAALLFTSCTPSTIGGPCAQTCDCKETTAPVRCPGEWVCNPQSLCEYTCKSSCDPNGVYTCPSCEDCIGTICWARL
jgi:hypothetical protein